MNGTIPGNAFKMDHGRIEDRFACQSVAAFSKRNELNRPKGGNMKIEFVQLQY